MTCWLYIGDPRSDPLSCCHNLVFMNISGLYFDRCVFSGHTCGAIDGDSTIEVKVSHRIVLMQRVTMNQSLLVSGRHYEQSLLVMHEP